jgi:hypothetical protein
MVNSIPALWNDNLGVISVGAADNGGKRLDLTQYLPNPKFPGTLVDVWAPGGLQDCPAANGQVVQRTGGTSIGEYLLQPS